jgi:hypothetical protein
MRVWWFGGAGEVMVTAVIEMMVVECDSEYLHTL